MSRAYRARLSLTPAELAEIHDLVKNEAQARDTLFWDKLRDKVERARERGDTRDEIKSEEG